MLKYLCMCSNGYLSLPFMIPASDLKWMGKGRNPTLKLTSSPSVTPHQISTENTNTTANSGRFQWHQCLVVGCLVPDDVSLIPCVLSALGLPAAKQSSLTTLAASFLAKWFKSFSTSKWNWMFHFNRSLEGDFAANDRGRCGVWFWDPWAYCTMCKDWNRGKHEVGSRGGSVKFQTQFSKTTCRKKLRSILQQLTYFTNITCCSMGCYGNYPESL